MTPEQQNLISKIILQTATADEFFSIDCSFLGSHTVLKLLSKWGLTVEHNVRRDNKTNYEVHIINPDREEFYSVFVYDKKISELYLPNGTFTYIDNRGVRRTKKG